MTQTVILSPDTASGVSTDIVVVAGGFVTVGIYSAAADRLPEGTVFAIEQDSPGADNTVDHLHNYKRTAVISGPGTFRVRRPAYSGTAFGVFSET